MNLATYIKVASFDSCAEHLKPETQLTFARNILAEGETVQFATQRSYTNSCVAKRTNSESVGLSAWDSDELLTVTADSLSAISAAAIYFHDGLVAQHAAAVDPPETSQSLANNYLRACMDGLHNASVCTLSSFKSMYSVVLQAGNELVFPDNRRVVR